MAGDSDTNIDARLRGAFHGEGVDGFEDVSGSARDAVVSGVRRRHHRRIAVAGGLTAAVAAVALVATLGVGGSPSGGPSGVHEGLGARHAPSATPSASGAAGGGAGGLSGSTPSATGGGSALGRSGSGVPAASGASKTARPGALGALAPATPYLPTSNCPRVIPSASHSAGSFVSSGQSDALSNGSYATQQGTAFGSAAMPQFPGPVHAVRGREVTVVLPAASPFARWSRPTVTSGSSVLVAAKETTHLARRGAQAVVFKAAHTGTAVVSAHAVCTPSAAASAAYQSICQGGSAHWHVTVEVAR